MTKIIFTSTFSAGMLSQASRKAGVVARIQEISLEEVKKIATHREYEHDTYNVISDVISAVGHPSTAKLMTSLLEIEIPFERIALAINPDEDETQLIVFQLDQSLFKRLNEGEVLDSAALEAANEAGALSWLKITFEAVSR